MLDWSTLTLLLAAATSDPGAAHGEPCAEPCEQPCAEPCEQPCAEPCAEIVVENKRDPASASTRTLDRADIEAMPGRSADDMLRAMPGLHQSAHGGRGKAYQYFLRGFDAVHGADLAVGVEGVPVNEVSNVHAHGYLDLYFLPPVLLRGIDLWPGTWRTEAGDFAVAGSADFHLGLEDAGGQVLLGVGSDTSGVATLGWRPTGSSPSTFLVADVDMGQGVGASRAWRQVRAGAGHELTLGRTQLRAWLLAYDGEFQSPGVLREDDLASGEVDFYDAYPGSGGGRSTRTLGSLQASGGYTHGAWRATTWLGWRSFDIRQNFTGWYSNEEHGDGTLQSYDAWTMGGQAQSWWTPDARITVQMGASARLDPLQQGEYGVETDGTIWETQATLTARQSDLGAWLTIPLRCTPWLQLQPGLRGELFLIAGRDEPLAWAPVLAPRFSATLFEDAPVTGFAAYGRGFRSPDARGAGDGGRAPVSTVDSMETGLTADPTHWLALRGTGFATFVSDEIIFDHAAARYLASGATRRLGVDGGLTVRPQDPLRLEVDLTWADGRYTQTEEPIPYAPRLLLVMGAYTEDLPLGGVRLTAGLRSWVLGPRPLPEGFASHTAAVVDLTSQLERGPWSLSVDVDNLLGSHWRDGEFLFPSRWDLDEPRAELPVRHFTAGTPAAVRLAVGRRF